MKLMAANLVETVDRFLHAGYVSAYPRPLDATAYPGGANYAGDTVQPVIQLDVAKALELSDGGTLDNAQAALATLGGVGSTDTQLLIGALAATGLFALFMLLRAKFQGRVFSAAPFALVAGLCLVMAVHCDTGGEEEKLPTKPPWEGVALQEYTSPEDATLVILHGIVVPAVANIGQGVETLANIQNEVALPAPTLTEGMKYALKTYGFDGWGNELRLETSGFKDADGEGFSDYTVTSAGPDATFDTEDDIAVAFRQTNNDSWGWSRNVFFLAKKTDLVVAFHRWNDEMFEYKNEDAAGKLFGTHLTDLFVEDDFYEDGKFAMIEETYNTVAEGLQEPPVVMQVFDTTNY